MMHFIQPGLLHLFAFSIDLFRTRGNSEVLKKNRNNHCLGLNNTSKSVIRFSKSVGDPATPASQSNTAQAYEMEQEILRG